MSVAPRREDYDVVVIGAGPAGLAAAATSAEAGLSTLLLDENMGPGGQVFRAIASTPVTDRSQLGGDYWVGADLVQALRASGAEVIHRATVWSLDRNLEIAVSIGGASAFVKAKRVILATGALERPFPIPGWTLPGVMTAGAAQTMLKSSALVPDGRTVIAGQGPLLWLLAAQILRLGGRIDRILDTTERSNYFAVLPHAFAFLTSPYFAKGLSMMREVKAKVLEIAAHMLEASPGDLQIENSVVSVKGVPTSGVPLAQIAMGAMLAPGLMPPGVDLKLEADTNYDGETGGWSSGSHACWVEIDPDTGKIEIKRYVVVEDCGTMINPGVVDGQVFGAVAMGIGGMLLEHSAYGPDGQYVAATFLDYLMPSAPEIPEIEIDHLEYQAPTMIGPRGVGEGGTVIAPAALMNAIDDALRQVGGARIEATPVTPTRVLEALGVIPRE
jgi:hypothetical protein